MEDIYSCAFHHELPHNCDGEVRKLDCGHYVSKNCLYGDIKLHKFSCKYCFKVYDRQECTNVIETSKELLKKDTEEFEKTFERFTEYENLLNNRVDFILDEIDVRVESLKFELDNSRDELRRNILDRKEKYIKNYKEIHQESVENMETLYEVKSSYSVYEAEQNRLELLEESIEKMKKFMQLLEFEISFDTNQEFLNSNIIGTLNSIKCFPQFQELVHPVEPNIIKLKRYLETQTYHSFEMDKDVEAIFVSLNDTILTLKADEPFVYVYDKSLKYIKKVSTKYDNEYRFNMITSNNLNRLYFCDSRIQHQQKIVMTDLNFKHIKTYKIDPYVIQSNTKSNKKIELTSRAIDITFHNNFLYICTINGHIVKLTSDLKFVEIIKLEITATRIKMIDNVACILDYDQSTVSFYNIQDGFKLLYRYKHLDVSRINVYDKYFILFPNSVVELSNQSMHVFRSNGETFEIIEINQVFSYLRIVSFVKFGELILKTFQNDDTDDDSDDFDDIDEDDDEDDDVDDDDEDE